MGEKIVTGIICMMSILFFLLALKIPPPHVESTLGSAFWPKVILALLFVLSGWQLVILLRRPKEEERRLAQLAEAKRKQDEEETGERFVQKLFYFSIAYSWLYIFSIRYVGFTIATLAMMSIYLFMTGYRNPIKNALVSLVTVVVYLALFVKATYIPLPRGFGFFKSISVLIY